MDKTLQDLAMAWKEFEDHRIEFYNGSWPGEAVPKPDFVEFMRYLVKENNDVKSKE